MCIWKRLFSGGNDTKKDACVPMRIVCGNCRCGTESCCSLCNSEPCGCNCGCDCGE